MKGFVQSTFQNPTREFAETAPCYRLWIEDGRIEYCDDYTFTLAMGEIAAVLFTKNEPRSVQKVYTVDD